MRGDLPHPGPHLWGPEGSRQRRQPGFERQGGDPVVNARIDTKPNIYYSAGTGPLNWPGEPTLPGNVHMPDSYWRTL